MWKLPRSKQRGSAIISALFLMGVIAMLAVTMLTRQNIEIRRTEIIFQEERLLAQLAWVELWAVQTLQTVFDQLTEEENFIILEQEWAKPLAEFQQEGIGVSGEITDLQAKFNVNNLLADLSESTSVEAEAEKLQDENNNPENNQNTTLTHAEEPPLEQEEVNPFDKETPYTPAWMFARLITQISKENINQAQVITENILHWIKPDITEADNNYLELNQPYQPAHQPLQSMSELRLIQYMDNNVLNALQPVATAFVSGDMQQNNEEAATNNEQEGTSSLSTQNELFPINVNTTTAPVLAAILNIESAEANNVLRARPFYTDEELHAQFSTLNLQTESSAAQSMLSITSYYFLLKAIARDDRRSIVQFTLLKRDPEGKVIILRRIQGEM